MARVLDLNIIEQPTLDLTMRDPDRTVVHINIPDTDLVKELQAREHQMRALLTSSDKDGVTAAYDLAARVISCNSDGLTFTAEELESKYKMNMYTLIAFFKEYNSFIHEIEKN